MTRYLHSLSGLLLAACLSSWTAADSGNLERFLPEDCHHWGSFEQEKHLAGLTQPLTTQGRFAFSCEQGLIWHSDTPLRETLVYPLKDPAWKLDAEGQRQALDGPVHKQLGNLLNRLIGGDLTYLNRHFQLRDLGDSLTLVPKAARMKKFVQDIRVTPGTEVVNLVMSHPGGEATHIRILAREALADLNADTCTRALPDLAPACRGLFP